MPSLPGSPFTPATPLAHEEEWADILTRLPPDITIRGMFFQPLVKQLTDESWAAIEPELEKPPRNRRHVAFAAYPQIDYHRVVLALAKQMQDETQGLAECIRKLSRDDLATFGQSAIGGVTMKLVGDWRGVLKKTPSVYRIVAPSAGGQLQAVDVAVGTVRMTFTNYPHNWPYQLGQLEGIVEYFNLVPSIEIEREDDVVSYTVRVD